MFNLVSHKLCYIEDMNLSRIIHVDNTTMRFSTTVTIPFVQLALLSIGLHSIYVSRTFQNNSKSMALRKSNYVCACAVTSFTLSQCCYVDSAYLTMCYGTEKYLNLDAVSTHRQFYISTH